MEVVLFPWEVGTILEAWKLWNAYASPEAFVGEADFLAEVLDMGRTSLAALAHVAEQATGAGLWEEAAAASLRVSTREGFYRWLWYWGQAYREGHRAAAQVRAGRYIPSRLPIPVQVSPRGESSGKPLPGFLSQGLGLTP